jgi:hypothetical protein
MLKVVRSFLFFVCAAQALLAIAFFVQVPLVVDLWPFEGTTPLTFMFVSSIYLAAAACTFWAAATKNYAALAGIGLDYLVMLTPVSFLLLQMAANAGSLQLTVYGIAFALAALFGLALFLWAARLPLDRTLAMPGLFRASFGVFILALFGVDGSLVLKAPNIIPWTITPQLSVVIGWMFLGAMTYFIYALVRPSWVNAAGQLAAFLAYDVVLIVPFLTRLPTVAPEHRISLIVYTLVVSYSGLLAIYYLFLHKPTRLWA